MIDIPFQSPAAAGRTALPAQQPRFDRRVARRIRLERKRRRAGKAPASPGRAGPRFGILAQHDHAGARPLRRERQPPACRQVVPGKAAFRFEKDQVHPRAARGLQPGPQEIEFTVRLHDRQAGRIEAQQDKPVSIEDRLKPRPLPRQQRRSRFPLAASAQGEGQRSRLTVPIGVNFVQLPARQRGNRLAGALRKPLCRTFAKPEDISGHAPNRSMCSCYVL